MSAPTPVRMWKVAAQQAVTPIKMVNRFATLVDNRYTQVITMRATPMTTLAIAGVEERRFTLPRIAAAPGGRPSRS